MVQHKVAKRKGGPTYTDRLCSMEKVFTIHEEELQKVKLEHSQLEWRELVLLDVLRHQEAVGAALQRFNELTSSDAAGTALDIRSFSLEPMSTSSDAQPGSPTLETHAVDQEAPNVDCTRPFADIPGQSYVLHLLQNSTQQQLQQVLDMTVEDWITYFRTLYQKLAILLNLALHATGKDWASVEAATAQHRRDSRTASSKVNSQPAEAALQGQATRPALPGCYSALSKQQCKASSSADPASNSGQASVCATSSASGADLAAATAEMQECCAEYIPGACLVSDMLRLNRLVDECFTLLLLGVMFNPMPVNEVMYVHLGTRERNFDCSLDVRRVIASSLQLTHGQAQQLAVSMKAFRSLHASTNAKCTQLTDKASDMGFMVAAAAAQLAQTSLAAAAATVSEVKPAPGAGRKASVSSKFRRKQGRARSGAQSAGKDDKVAVASGLQETPADMPVSEAANAAPSNDASEEDNSNVEQALHCNLYRRLILQLLEYMFISNTLTHLQKAALLVSSYPSALVITSTAEAVKQKLDRPASRSADADSKGGLAGEGAADSNDVSSYWRCMQDDHEQRRNVLLREQRQQWFKELEEDWGFMV